MNKLQGTRQGHETPSLVCVCVSEKGKPERVNLAS